MADALALGGDEGRDKLRKLREGANNLDPKINETTHSLKNCYPFMEANLVN